MKKSVFSWIVEKILGVVTPMGAVYCPPSEFGESKDEKEKTNKEKSKSVDKKKNG